MSFVITKKDKAGNLHYLRDVVSACQLPETMTACEKAGICPLPGWSKLPIQSYLFDTSEEALNTIDALPKCTVYTVSKFETLPSLSEMFLKKK